MLSKATQNNTNLIFFIASNLSFDIMNFFRDATSADKKFCKTI